MNSEYLNPAEIFLENNEVIELADVIRYANFLREQSGLSNSPPINLQKIHERFQIPLPQQAAFTKQQGAIIELDGKPQILIKEDDSYLRQRFTQAHELIEILFKELPGEIRIDRQKENIFGSKKENICQIAAAHLLMPQSSFQPKAIELGLSFQTGIALATEYGVSLTAALFRVVDQFPNSSAVILWRLKNKPKELKSKVPEGQMAMPGFDPVVIAAPKLRVEWAYGNYKNVYIPQDKSISENSSVYKCWNTDTNYYEIELLPFGRLGIEAMIENMTMNINGERCVLSLVHNPK